MKSITSHSGQGKNNVLTESRYRGCIFGGAIGDALGAAVEFSSRDEILRKFGPDGIKDYAPCYGGIGRITDDTQMTLFTAEALMMSWCQQTQYQHQHELTEIEYLNFKNAYLRWLQTQNGMMNNNRQVGLLKRYPQLLSARAPGMTCLSALRQISNTSAWTADNNSKGCGSVMRVAPIALMAHASCHHKTEHQQMIAMRWIEQRALASAALTHGHITGQIAAAAFALLLFDLLSGQSPIQAVEQTIEWIEKMPLHDETTAILKQACQLANSDRIAHQAIALLGQGWIAEEALGIAVYCLLKASRLEQGILMAVNITGDSDSTGSMAGQLLGAYYGFEALPTRWLKDLELKELLEEMCADWQSIDAYHHMGLAVDDQASILSKLKARYDF